MIGAVVGSGAPLALAELSKTSSSSKLGAIEVRLPPAVPDARASRRGAVLGPARLGKRPLPPLGAVTAA